MKKTDDSTIYQLIIIGGGAAGLYAGAAVCQLSPAFSKKHRGLILERKPESGKKLLITGAGQCNLTHSGSIKDFVSHYHEGGKKIRTLLYSHSNEQVIAALREMGLETFTREDGKVFPVSLSARNVRDTLLRHCEKNGFLFHTDTECTDLIPCQQSEKDTGSETDGTDAAGTGAAKARWKTVCGSREYLAENVLITTGGASVPATGSDGSFLNLMTRLEIPITPLTPALTPVFVQQYPFGDLSGISFPEISIVIYDRDHRKKAENHGALLLTHDSLSGPCIIDSSRYIETGDLLKINWLSGSSQEELLQRLTADASKTKASAASHVTKVLKEMKSPLPQRFIDLQLQRCDVDLSQKAAQTGKKIWQAVLRIFTEDTFSVSGKGGFASAMATRGGISLDAVNLKTMESKQYPGLWFAGEVLDIDGDTGGYNLQFAFSSAACAVKNIYKK